MSTDYFVVIDFTLKFIFGFMISNQIVWWVLYHFRILFFVFIFDKKMKIFFRSCSTLVSQTHFKKWYFNSPKKEISQIFLYLFLENLKVCYLKNSKSANNKEKLKIKTQSKKHFQKWYQNESVNFVLINFMLLHFQFRVLRFIHGFLS